MSDKNTAASANAGSSTGSTLSGKDSVPETNEKSMVEIPQQKKGLFSSKKKSDKKPKADAKGAKKGKAELDYSAVDSEKDIETLKSQTFIETQKAGFWAMYKYADNYDKLMLFLGFFFSIVHGVALPMFTIVVGGITNNFNSFVGDGTTGAMEFQRQVNHNALYFVYIGVALIGSATLESFILVKTGERLAGRYRKAYFRAIIRQNIAYFDNLGSGEVSTRITNDTIAIQEAISEKSGNILAGLSTFIAGLIIGFVSHWKMACILLSGVVFVLSTMFGSMVFIVKGTVRGEMNYSVGSSMAEEALSAIRNTVAFGLQAKMADRFDVYLKKTGKFNEYRNVAFSVMLGLLWSAVFFIYALSMWEGSRLIASGETSIGKVLTVIMAMLIGAFQIGNKAGNFQFIAKGLAAAASINETINRIPVIDSIDEDGLKPESVAGEIKVRNIKFRYPSRPDVLVLPDFSLDVQPGQTVALVGASGSGKSTIIGLLERFYLPLEGSISLDGVDIKDLNIQWLRRQIGYVSQEPTLFSDSIYENIAYGLIGTEFEDASEEIKREKVIEACKQANAWDFIQLLSDGLDTNVGDRGFLMSGGQKQRIAIARAIISNPKILLLDEATSALDTKSEGIVQEALDRAAKQRSTIVIAHRLSTIKDADKIVVMNKGVVVEQGTHHELYMKKGTYYNLVEAQQIVRQHAALNKTSVGDDDYEVEDEANERVRPLEIHEDAFVVEDDGLSKSESRATRIVSRPENLISGMQPVEVSFGKIVKMLWDINRNERSIIILGCIGAFFLGSGYPALGLLMGRSMESILVPPSHYGEMRKQINLYSGLFFMVGCEQLIAGFLTIRLLSHAGEKLLRGVRLSLFRQYLRMDIAFFDHKKNTSGSLTAVMAKDGKAIEGLGGATFGQILNSLVMVVAGIIVGIAFNWNLGLVGLACVPFVMGAGYMRLAVMSRLEARGRAVYEDSGSMAAQYVTAVRTVQSLTREASVQKIYSDSIDALLNSSSWPVLQSAVLYSFSESFPPFVLALIFWHGSTLLRKGKIGIFAYYVVFVGTVMGAQAAGAVFSWAPDMGKARQSSSNILQVLEARPSIDTLSTEGSSLTADDVKGHIELRGIHFRYPTRPQVPVLRGVDITVSPGQFVALVGPSGSGKSTTIGLLERFYNPHRGEILLDGKDISSININEYRSQFALVQQEPMLYSGTVKENISFGWNGGNTDGLTDEMIIDAAKKANIHEFIMSLPEGYDTTVGSRGGLLSGGQKQRIAIARALIRNPKVLLLDEATSALDSESEKVVQAALDAAAKGRTTVAVAHRLSTIQNADVIYVFEAGRIVEQGKHAELLDLNGRYAELVRLQALEN